MTFEEWKATKSRTNDLSVIENAFGYELPQAVAAIVYECGVIAVLDGGVCFAQIDRGEYEGSEDDVEASLWHHYAKYEVGQ